MDGKLYDFDQWDVQYNRPDKVLKAMGCNDKELIEAFAQARQKRLRRMGINEKQLQTGYQLPSIQLNNKCCCVKILLIAIIVAKPSKLI